MKVTFVIPGPPQPKERARKGRVRSTGRVVWYTPAPTRRYEQAVKENAMAAFARMSEPWPTDRRYRLEVHCYFQDARHRDADNVLKAVSDALNKLAYADDSQVSVCTSVRDCDQANPRTVVTLEVLP